MPFNKYTNNRKAYRLKNYDYSQKGYYFITICTYDKKKLFAKRDHNKMILTPQGKMVEYGKRVKAKLWLPYNKKLWQTRYHDHIINSDRELKIIRNYIRQNPQKWLVKQKGINN